ncbi:hypothetical protein HanIR_Chr15g0759581 [Helianthus annuus]|nr:hypothetical protein HanIR_Chr15g0759581 [Helianthus annuus]
MCYACKFKPSNKFIKLNKIKLQYLVLIFNSLRFLFYMCNTYRAFKTLIFFVNAIAIIDFFPKHILMNLWHP